MSTVPVPNMTAEEDFEFVPSQNHDHDDLSSITSNAGETDNESDAGALDSQAGSNITLRMPQVTESTQHVTQAAQATRKMMPELVGLPLPETKVEFDLKSHEKVELPVLYWGPEQHKKMILSKIASALLPEFTSDVWTSTTYSILPSDESDTAEVVPQSRLSFRVVADGRQLSKSERPFLIIRVDSPNTTLDSTVGSPQDDEPAKGVGTDQEWINVPLLLLHGDTETASAATTSLEYGPDSTNLLWIVDSTGPSQARKRPLTIAEFSKLDEKTTEKLTDGLVHGLDLWHEARRSARSPRTTDGTVDVGSIYKLLPWLLLLISAVMHYSAYASAPSHMFSTPGKPSPSALFFHQITQTNALIEVPGIYRAQPAQMLPKMTAVVTRDGKQIHSRLQLVVDNLYSLDWAQTEAHGELVVTAQMVAKKKTLESAYVIEYSAKTPFLLSLMEKMHDMNNLRHLPEVDFSRRVNELVKQLEDSRSYAVSLSQNQLRHLRDTSSEGFRKLSRSYPSVLQASGDSIKGVLAKTSALSAQIGQQSIKQIAHAEAGFQKLKRMMHRHKPLVQKHSIPAKWAHQFRKGFRSRKN